MLSLASLEHRVPRAVALHPALQTRVPSAKWLRPTPQLSGRRAESLRPWYCNLEPRGALAPPHSPELHPPSPLSGPYKAAPPTAFGGRVGGRGWRESVDSKAGAHTSSPCFDQRINFPLLLNRTQSSIGSNDIGQEDPR